MSLSTYYNEVSQYYDDERKPIGADLIVGVLQAANPKGFGKLHVLDAGCGTGNYSDTLMKLGVGKVTLLDASPGMLEAARDKLQSKYGSEKIVDVICKSLPSIPFPDASFDAVMFNQVLHHLDLKDGDDQMVPYQEALKEAYRVLKPGGTLVLQVCTKEQVGTFWYIAMLADAMMADILEKYLKGFPTSEQFYEYLNTAGFNQIQRIAHLDSTHLDPKAYSDLDGPWSEKWRIRESFFSFLSENDLNKLLSSCYLDKEIRLKHFCKCEAERKRIGMTTSVYAVK